MNPELKRHLPSLRRGIYIAPSGKKVPFDFEGNEEFSQSKKIAFQEVPLSNAWVAQDLGTGMLTFSIKMLFSGMNADKNCKTMIGALSESGSGVLKHPYGENILCIPTAWTHKPTNTESIRLARLSVSFAKTLKQPYPAMKRDFEGDMDLVRKKMFSPTRNFAQKIQLASKKQIQKMQNTLETGLKYALAPFEELASVTTELQSLLFQSQLQFKNLLDTDAPILETFYLIENIVDGMRSSKIDLESKKNAYKDSIQRLFSLFYENKHKDIELDVSKHLLKIFAISKFFSLKNSKPQTPELLSFSKDNITLYKQILDLDIFDEQDCFLLLEALHLSSGEIQNRLEKLPKYQKYSLEEDATPINACFKIHGNLDKLDDLIQINHLKAHELFFLKKEQDLVFYG